LLIRISFHLTTYACMVQSEEDGREIKITEVKKKKSASVDRWQILYNYGNYYN
jgi:hypothetical protein